MANSASLLLAGQVDSRLHPPDHRQLGVACDFCGQLGSVVLSGDAEVSKNGVHSRRLLQKIVQAVGLFDGLVGDDGTAQSLRSSAEQREQQQTSMEPMTCHLVRVGYVSAIQLSNGDRRTRLRCWCA
ncbi:hypothetical protein VTN31DRAFT_1369 [Thermomyces dupontii]|uniref:uncharacterized protein n=1 Tax=Talaromyces thermophilus TaxID=28565 RepID=UPI0037444540